jgi:DNA repair protein SbcC/Rad50
VRILAIRGSNLASLAGDFEIALNQAPLMHCGVFAITGNTGAGKSTILDAMCLALFDRMPRMAMRSTVFVAAADDEDNQLGDGDVRGILRRGAGRGFAEVDFESDDREIYRARWTVRRSHNKATGALQHQEMSLHALRDGSVLGGKKTETLVAIRERLGLSFEQFRRSVLLAQGDFAAFLRSDGKERSDLLERMTGTQIYSTISKLAHQRAAAHRKQVTEWQSAMNATTCLDDPGRLQLEQRIADQDDELKTAQIKLIELQQQQVWRTQDKVWTQQLSAAEHALSIVVELHTAAGSAREHVALRRRLQPAQAKWLEIQATMTLQREAENRYQVAENLQVSTTAAIRFVQDVLGKCTECINELVDILPARSPEMEPAKGTRASGPSQASWDVGGVIAGQVQVQAQAVLLALRSQPQLGALGPKWPMIEQSLHAVEHAMIQMEQLQRSLLSDSAAVAAMQQNVVKEQQLLQQAQQLLAVATNTAESYDRGRKLQPDTGRRLEDAARQRINDIESLQTCCGQAAALQQQRAGSGVEMAAFDKQLKQWAKQQRQLTTRLTAAAAQWQESVQTLNRISKAASLTQHRAALVDGEPCLVCGSVQHPWASHSIVEDLRDGQQSRVAELRAVHDKCQQAVQLLNTDVAVATRQRELLAAELPRLDAQQVELQEKWRSGHVDLAALQLIASPADEGAATWLAGQHKAARDGLQHARAEREKAVKAAQAAAEAIGMMEMQRRQVHTFADQLQKLQLAIETRKARRDRDAERLEIVKVEGAGTLQDLIARWGDVVPQITQWQHLDAIASDRISDLRQQLAAQVKHWQSVVGQAYPLLRTLQAAQLQQQGILAKRLQEQATHLAVAAAAQSDALRLQTTILVGSGALNTVLSAFGVSVSEAQMWFTQPASELAQEQAALEWLDQKRSSAEQIVIERQRVWQEHQAHLSMQAPALRTLDDEELLADVGRAQQQQRGCADLLQTLHAERAVDDDRRLRIQQIQQQICNADTAAMHQVALANAIGSHDGKVFRAFAQGLTLDALIEQANDHLRSLAPRYGLARVPKHDLELQIVDFDMANEVRPITSLSGGETFLMSLALALGLSSLSAHSVRVQSLFIDEGFGTLDAATLDTALAVLDSLQSTGRQVGIISHVPAIAERVGASVVVQSRSAGKSQVTVMATGL